MENKNKQTPVETAQTTSTPVDVALFSTPSFTRPDRTVKTKDGKSQMVAQVEFTLGGMLHVETGIWCRNTIDRDKGVEILDFSVSLPRGVRPIKGDAESVEKVNQWKQDTLNAFDVWELAQTAEQQKAATTGGARLVRTKPLTDNKTTPAPQTVPSK